MRALSGTMKMKNGYIHAYMSVRAVADVRDASVSVKGITSNELYNPMDCADSRTAHNTGREAKNQVWNLRNKDQME